MTPKEISKIIEKEISDDWSITIAHGCDLKKCLIRPKKRDLSFHSEIKEVWIVLEEKPETLEGYKVYFDDKTGKFGLAQHSDSPEYFGYTCNSYDTFLEAFKSM